MLHAKGQSSDETNVFDKCGEEYFYHNLSSASEPADEQNTVCKLDQASVSRSDWQLDCWLQNAPSEFFDSERICLDTALQSLRLCSIIICLAYRREWQERWEEGGAI